jgi:hypothetical protein
MNIQEVQEEQMCKNQKQAQSLRNIGVGFMQRLGISIMFMRDMGNGKREDGKREDGKREDRKREDGKRELNCLRK